MQKLLQQHPSPWCFRVSLNDGASVIDANKNVVMTSENHALLKLVALLPSMVSQLEESCRLPHMSAMDVITHAEWAKTLCAKVEGIA